MNTLPFAHLTNRELQNPFETGSDKLKSIIKNSKLPNHLSQLVPYFQQVVPGSSYYAEDEFNSYVSKINPEFSIFSPKCIRSLNCHHKKLVTYLQLLDLKFDCICLSEVWSTNLNSYKSIFQDYIPFFAEPINNNVGGVTMFIKNIYKVSERKDLKIAYSAKVKIEDLWVEITNDNDKKHVIGMIYRHPGGDVKQFTEQLENTLSRIENDKTIKHNIITGDFNIDLIKLDLNDNTMNT